MVIVSGNVTFSVVGLGLLTTDSFASTFLFTLRSRRNLLVSFKELAGGNLLRSPTRGVKLLLIAVEIAVSTLHHHRLYKFWD